MKRPFAWTRRWHAIFHELCARRWGMELGPPESPVLSGAIERAYGASDASSLSELARRLRDLPERDPEVQAFIAVVAVGETGFFRNRPQFDALEKHVLPEIIARRREDRSLRLRIWSAGCATGEEPYTIAMLVHELLPDRRRWDVKILATDLNLSALRRAREAIYTDWSFREADPRRTARFFSRVDSLLRFDHPCKELVTFEHLNLTNAHFPGPVLGSESFDLIFCRNVMIYFRHQDQARAVALFLRALAPGGWLAVGHSEPDPKVFAEYEEVEFPDTFLYRRPDGSPRPQPVAVPRGPATATCVEQPGRPSTAAAEALAAFDRDQPELSAARLEGLAERDPGDPTAPHLLAQLAADGGRYGDALFWAFTALQRDPLHVATLLLMGLVHLEQGELARAKRSIRQALFLEPGAPEAHLFLALALEKLGDERGAARHRERASRLATSTATGPLLPIQQARLVLRAG